MRIRPNLYGRQPGTMVNGTSRVPDALADPLEGEEWHGLRWTIPVAARLIAHPRSEPKIASKNSNVQRFTGLTLVKEV